MRLSVVGLGGLLARYEGFCGHPPPEEKREIYLRATELGINLFDMGYGDEVHIPDELKGNSEERHFSLKVGAAQAETLAEKVDAHLANLRREAIDILRIHHHRYVQDEGLAACVAALKQAGKVRALCLIRHDPADQEAYAAHGPEPDSDADLVIYNYVCRTQEPGIEMAATAGKGVLIMKALGGQWLSWEDKTRTDWSAATQEAVVRLSPKGEKMRKYLELVYPITSGPWGELAEPGETLPRPGRAVSWVLENEKVSSVLVAFASVAELEEVVLCRI
jgi:aryl-alcohol dehydrogenase-like predicted oxidoreductase